MKRMIKANDVVLGFDVGKIKIQSLVFVDDARNCQPRQHFQPQVAVIAGTKIPYSTLTREQILELPKRERERIHDIDALRKLNVDELAIQQKMEVSRANQDNFLSTRKLVKEMLSKVQSQNKVFMFPTQKNNSFVSSIHELGGEITDKDVTNIVSKLSSEDYSYSTLSYLDINWNALLMVFEFEGSYVFEPLSPDYEPVEVSNLDIYIKIDVDTLHEEGYAAMSFHNPEFTPMKHPFRYNQGENG